MTTNIVESLNSMLMNKRENPVSYIFNSIAKKFGEKFRERYAFVDSQNNKFMPCAERILRDNKSVSDSLYGTNANGGLDQFTVFGSGVTAKSGGHGFKSHLHHTQVRGRTFPKERGNDGTQRVATYLGLALAGGVGRVRAPYGSGPIKGGLRLSLLAIAFSAVG
ncbi:hypothetical protein BC332_00961 [Capsicum chinense]|nr:hypothetical protein BC332_00961 [Capsicum chinense]